MSKIFCIVGKSCSGKDTLYQGILALDRPELVPVVPCTTRPRRSGERDGVDYRFVTEAQLESLQAAGQVIELRQYHTTQGLWSYFTPRFALNPGKNYLLVTTLEGARGLVEHYGEERVCLIYLHLDDYSRLMRCVQRESRQAAPDYAEVCRRFLADQEDFSPENLARFPNLYRIDTRLPAAECVRAWEALYDTFS